MKRIGTPPLDGIVVGKAERHRRYSWCRLWNDFLDRPILRVVADMTGLPLYQVQAFVVRLEVLANAAEPRGYIGDFRPAEFGAALGMPVDEVVRLYAALDHADVCWIDQDHVAGFYDRNRDREDSDYRERKQRSRDREAIRKLLAVRAQQELITAEQRDSVGAIVELMDDGDLATFKQLLRRGAAMESALSTCHSVTRVTAGLLPLEKAATDSVEVSDFSTGHAGHIVTGRDNVTVPPRADQKSKVSTVENSGDSAGGEAQGLPMQGGEALHLTEAEHAELWLVTEGRRIVTERLNEPSPRAMQRIDRWRQSLFGDVCALAAIIDRASASDLVVSRFLTVITSAIEQQRHERNGPPLPLKTVIQSTDVRRKGHG